MPNKSTTQLRATLKPIKKAVIAYFKPDVLTETEKWEVPTHHIVMRTTNDFVEYEEGHEISEQERLTDAMKRNPYVTISFTALSRTAPQTVNSDTLTEFIEYLNDNGFVPENIEIALSPYNLTQHSNAGALNLVIIFNEEDFATEQEVSPVKRTINPMDYLVV